MDDDAIQTLVARLARPHSSGGRVVERAAILAEGADFHAVMAWVEKHGGEAEVLPAPTPRGGLHGGRGAVAEARVPLRFVLPPDAPA